MTGPASAGTAGPSVAQASKAWLVANTVPKRAVLMVPAPDARRALDGVASLLGPRHTVLVVTDAVDALFIERLGAGLGLHVVVSPPLGSQQSLPSLVTGIGPLWRESSAMALGRIVGFGRIDWAGG